MVAVVAAVVVVVAVEAMDVAWVAAHEDTAAAVDMDVAVVAVVVEAEDTDEAEGPPKLTLLAPSSESPPHQAYFNSKLLLLANWDCKISP